MVNSSRNAQEFTSLEAGDWSGYLHATGKKSRDEGEGKEKNESQES